MLRLYGAYKEEGNLAVDVSFLIDPEGFVGDVCNFLVSKPLIFAALTFDYTVVPGAHGGLLQWIICLCRVCSCEQERQSSAAIAQEF